MAGAPRAFTWIYGRGPQGLYLEAPRVFTWIYGRGPQGLYLEAPRQVRYLDIWQGPPGSLPGGHAMVCGEQDLPQATGQVCLVRGVHANGPPLRAGGRERLFQSYPSASIGRFPV